MYTYTTWLSGFANNLVIPLTDPNFAIMVPNAIDDCEQWAYRELQLLNTVSSDTGGTFNTGTRSQGLPSTNGTFYVVNSIYAITPAGATTGNGTRNPLTPASRDYLDWTYPSSTASGVPQYFSMTTQTSFIVGPWPNLTYTMEVNGTLRPAPLSSTNVTTLLTVYFPDLWMAGTLAFGFSYLQNYGAAGYVDNPQAPATWMQHAQNLLKSAQTEEAMKRFTSQGWSSKPPAQIATPQRT